MQLDSSELQCVEAFISKSLAICEVHESSILLQLSKPLLLSILYLCVKRKQHKLISHYVISPNNTSQGNDGYVEGSETNQHARFWEAYLL
jgi:hypothetical protein